MTTESASLASRARRFLEPTPSIRIPGETYALIRDLLARCEELETALEKYGDHLGTTVEHDACPAIWGKPDCTCGWDKLAPPARQPGDAT